MKIMSDIILATIVSFEFLVVCVVAALIIWFPGSLTRVGSAFQSHKEAFQWLSIACGGVLVLALRWGHEILVPKHEHSAILATWPKFYMLKNRTLIGICYVVAGTCVAVTIWIFNADIRDPKISGAYCGAVTVVMISALSLWYATIQLGVRLQHLRHKQREN
jgi:hypothetical protein